MECTKGELKVDGNCYAKDEQGKIAFSTCHIAGLPSDVQIVNTKELVRRWNAFEKDGLVDGLRAALKDVQKRIKNSEEWWIDCPDKGGFDTDIIEAAIAKVT